MSLETADHEQLYPLIKQWCNARDQAIACHALQQIALMTECVQLTPDTWGEKQTQTVVRWLQDNHPNAYLLAMSQQCVGHPAMVWGNTAQSAALRWKSC